MPLASYRLTPGVSCTSVFPPGLVDMEAAYAWCRTLRAGILHELPPSGLLPSPGPPHQPPIKKRPLVLPPPRPQTVDVIQTPLGDYMSEEVNETAELFISFTPAEPPPEPPPPRFWRLVRLSIELR